MKNTHVKVENIFGDMIRKVSVSPGQRCKLNTFLGKILRILIFVWREFFLKLEKNKFKNYETTAPPDYEKNL